MAAVNLTDSTTVKEEFKSLCAKIDMHIKSLPKRCTRDDHEHWTKERESWREQSSALENTLQSETMKVHYLVIWHYSFTKFLSTQVEKLIETMETLEKENDKMVALLCTLYNRQKRRAETVTKIFAYQKSGH